MTSFYAAARNWSARSSLLRFLLVGGISALAYVVTCTVLTHFFPEHGALISITVYSISIPIVYGFQRNFTFRSSGPVLKQFAGYFAVQLVSISTSTHLFARYLSGNVVTDGALFVAISLGAAVVSYLICRFIVFERRLPSS